MSHQPFEAWILDPEKLTAEERRALRAHLGECQSCQRLAEKWQTVSLQLRARPMAEPRPGFAQRWQLSLAERRAREQRRQAWKVFGLLAAGALFILLLLSGYLLATTSTTEWLARLVNFFASSREIIDLTSFAIQSWLAMTPLALNIALWIALTISLCALSIVWGLIFWRTKSAGVVNS